MNNIWSIFIISVIGVVIFGGVGTIIDFSFEKNLLDQESTLLYLEYNSAWLGIETDYSGLEDDLYSNNINQGEVNPDVNLLESFVKEYGEAKARVGVLRNSMRMFTLLPAMLFMSVPFINNEDVKYYVGVLFIVLIVMISIATFKALFQRRVDEK